MKGKIVFILILLFPLLTFAENASNIRVRQEGKDIIITYDLSMTSNVTVFVATSALYYYSFVPLKAVDGAVGKHVAAGKNLEIKWHPLQEHERFIENNVRFKVEAIGTYEQYALPKSRKGNNLGGKTNMETFLLADFAYSVAPQFSYGIMFGQTYSGIGWYVNARSNFHFLSATEGLSCDQEGYIGFLLPFYSGQTQSSSFVTNVGFIVDALEITGGSQRNRFNTLGIYLGLGYGWRRMLWETLDHKWIQYEPTSTHGISTHAGLIGSIYGLTLKIGINTINFKYLELEAGIGWMF